MKKRILISAYAISPVKGSEYGAAWNTVINLATQHELWVLYGMSDSYMGDTQTMRAFVDATPLKSVHFVEVKPGWLAKGITLLDKAGLGWFFYFAYYLWQKNALKAAREICKTVDIDVVHQLGPIGFREPGFLAQLQKPLVWGPIGGMNKIDKRLLINKPWLTRFKFMLKNYINHLQLNYSGRIARAFEQADVCIAATSSGQQTISEKFGVESYYLSEQGVITVPFLDELKFKYIKQCVQLVWCGNLIERKNLDMCLDVLSGLQQANWKLHILGSGPNEQKLKQKAANLNLQDKITWHGHIPRAEAIGIISASHLHIITSIAEDNPAVIFEALTYGVPTLTIDHCGMGDVISDKSGIKIKNDGYTVMVDKMRAALVAVLNNPSVLNGLAQTTVQEASKHNWNARLTTLNSMYNKAIGIHTARTTGLPLIYSSLTS
ncbi:glycosyltransferase family 4 protein [Mucilaginibacter flavus]|uniref:glycosyltransferase family 4 protein n=1 Tax=Mucilaginibacter flavus TaxID=931504 RepID=UPI0025B505CE|nr:glycosyltransferase family 4 protein [Mucilaginibacter flavus]MDN3584446.1 glycosyltransferase family 4 protein [Mucilaginibacter flavus]